MDTDYRDTKYFDISYRTLLLALRSLTSPLCFVLMPNETFRRNDYRRHVDVQFDFTYHSSIPRTDDLQVDDLIICSSPAVVGGCAGSAQHMIQRNMRQIMIMLIVRIPPSKHELQ